jgi:O-Antigen ligase
MRFFLFLLANALLFIRPSELIPDLAAVEIYRWFILACLAVSLPAIVQQLSLRFPGMPPVVTCVALLLPAVFLSGLFHGNFELIQDTVTEFAKIVIYFLLMIALITDTAKLRQFLRWIGVCSAAVTLVAVVRYHSDVAAPPPTPTNVPKDEMKKKNAMHGTFVVDEVRDPKTGEITKVNRMCGTGIFNDPNDLALVLIAAVPMCLCWITDPSKKMTRPLWLGFLLLFGYALMLTHSRGGFLALLAGLGTLFYLKFGSKKTILLGLLFLPVLLVVFAGRMTNISADEGTGQTRIQLWSDGLYIFRMSPLFGIGMDNYTQFSSHVAHHSFIHCFTELGLIGGTLFLGAYYFALKGIYHLRAKPNSADDVDPELLRLHPFLAATLVAYTIGICFLSRSYVVPTYMMLGLAVVYMRLRVNETPIALPALTIFAWPQLAGISFGFLAVSYVFVRVFVNWG